MGLYTWANTFDFGTTEVENLFITDFMLLADGVSIKTYLLGLHALRHVDGVKDMTNRKLAKHMNVSLDDVVRAWKFWQEKGLVKLSKPHDDPQEFDVIFIPIRQKYLDSNYVTLERGQIEGRGDTLLSPSSKLQFYEKNEENWKLRLYVESRLQRELQSGELIGLYEFAQEVGLEHNLIKFAFEHAQARGKINRRGKWTYVYRMIEGWKRAGVQTIEQAEHHIETRSAAYKFAYELEKLTGTSGTAVVFVKMIEKWKQKYDYSPGFIEKVCKYMRKTRAKLVPAQVDAYFDELYENQVKTLEDFATYLSAGEYAFTLMKETGLWMAADIMRSTLKKWHEAYGYGKEMIRHILMEQKKKRNNLTLSIAENALKEAYENKIGSIEAYNRYANQTGNQNKSNYDKKNTRKNNFGKFTQREKTNLGQVVETAWHAQKRSDKL